MTHSSHPPRAAQLAAELTAAAAAEEASSAVAAVEAAVEQDAFVEWADANVAATVAEEEEEEEIEPPDEVFDDFPFDDEFRPPSPGEQQHRVRAGVLLCLCVRPLRTAASCARSDGARDAHSLHVCSAHPRAQVRTHLRRARLARGRGSSTETPPST